VTGWRTIDTPPGSGGIVGCALGTAGTTGAGVVGTGAGVGSAGVAGTGIDGAGTGTTGAGVAGAVFIGIGSGVGAAVGGIAGGFTGAGIAGFGGVTGLGGIVCGGSFVGSSALPYDWPGMLLAGSLVFDRSGNSRGRSEPVVAVRIGCVAEDPGSIDGEPGRAGFAVVVGNAGAAGTVTAGGEFVVVVFGIAGAGGVGVVSLPNRRRNSPGFF
jgi:hypothetical protein